MKEFIEKSNQATAAYLNRRGYEIVEQPWEDDIDSPVSIVAQDEDSLVFVSVAARRNSDSFPQEHVNEEELEGFAISWLKDNHDHAACAAGPMGSAAFGEQSAKHQKGSPPWDSICI